MKPLKPLRKFFKWARKHGFFYKLFIVVAALSLLATSVLPYLR